MPCSLRSPASRTTAVGRNGAPEDSLELRIGGVNTPDATSITHTFNTENDGSINWDGAVLTYTGLEPIIDDMGAVNRTFTYTSAMTETITLADFMLPGDGLMTIDSNAAGEVITSFPTPTTSITINTTGGGADGGHRGHRFAGHDVQRRRSRFDDQRHGHG